MSDESLLLNGDLGAAGDESPVKGKRRLDEERRLDPWERYRVLTDISKLQLDMLEMADRRTRFALLILGTLNALNMLVVARPDLLAPAGMHVEPMPGTAAYVIAYAALSVFLFVQAVVALRPRVAPLIDKEAGTDRRLRHLGAIASQTADEYLDGWRQATIGNVNKELASHVQHSARATAEKYTAVGRLYWGLMILVFMTAGMLALVVVRMLLGSPTA